MTHWPEQFSTEGNHVRIVPMTFDHQRDLEEAAADGELHRLWYTNIPAQALRRHIYLVVPAAAQRRAGILRHDAGGNCDWA